MESGRTRVVRWKWSAISPISLAWRILRIVRIGRPWQELNVASPRFAFAGEIGRYLCDGSRVNYLDVDGLSYIRNRKYGFLFSAPFLLPTFSVLENVAIPLFKIAEVDALEAKVIVEEILEMLGISRIANATVEDLKGLDGMLAALARALVHHPRVLIAERVGCNLQEYEANALLSILGEAGDDLDLL